MRILLSVTLSAAVLAACTTSEVAEMPAEQVLLSDAEVQRLWSEAYDIDEQSETEAAFTALIERDDISEPQRAYFYMGRGIKRGIFTRDDTYAYPQCAVLDFREYEKRVGPEDARMAQMQENRSYQFSRFKYFPNAPEVCKTQAAEYKAEVYAR